MASLRETRGGGRGDGCPPIIDAARFGAVPRVVRANQTQRRLLSRFFPPPPYAALAIRGARSGRKSSTGLLADRLEKRLTKPERLEEVLCSLLTCGKQTERRAVHAAAEAKLNGFTTRLKTARRVDLGLRPRKAGTRRPSLVRNWRSQGESNPCFRRERGITCTLANVCERITPRNH